MTTPNLTLPFIAAQASAHSLVDDAFNRLDAIVQMRIVDRDLSAPPGSPTEGDLYLIAASPSGAWTGHAGDLALYYSGWIFYTPKEGWRIWVRDEDKFLIFNGTIWLEPGRANSDFGLTDGATINTDASKASVYHVTLGGNRTMAAPTNPQPWQRIIYAIKQDGTGSRTLTWNSAFRFSGATAPTLTTTANKTDYIGFLYNATDSKWDNLGANYNF